MSLFGKIMALFNIFGAIALVCLAAMDYAKRQSWAYSVFRHQIALNGLPLDGEEKDAMGIPLAPQIGPNTMADLFSQVGGDGVQTQLAEVLRVQDLLDGQVKAAESSKRQQDYLFSRILLPLSDSILEREQLLACQFWLSSDAQASLLKARFTTAYKEAIKPPPPPPMGQPPHPEPTFEDAFRLALRAQPGHPSEMLATLVLRGMPADIKGAATANFDQAYDTAVETQHTQLEKRYRDHFATAMAGVEASDGKGQGLDAQKAAVGDLLFGLAPYLAENAIDTDPGKAQEKARLAGLDRSSAAFSDQLVNSPTFGQYVRRLYVVCGIKNGLNAISRRSAVLRHLADSMTSIVTAERLQFVADQTALIAQARELAVYVQTELGLKTESERKLTLQQEQVKKRQRDVKQLEDELRESRDLTAAKLKELRAVSQKLLEDRVHARDLIRLTEQAEKKIRELETQIRTREVDR